jgi:fructose-1,6-bisphosphatase/inositol monophosphatase family enzyme
MVGHDRFVADLRSVALPALSGVKAPLCCHPYDACTALIAREAGVEVTDGRGQPLDAPLDTTTGLSWIGYANRALRVAVEPVLLGLMARRGWIPAPDEAG